jgi:integrase
LPSEWRQARRIVTVPLGSGLQRGELLALRWRDVALLEGTLTVRAAVVRGEFPNPKSRKSLRAFQLGTVTLAALNEQWQETAYKTDDDVVFCHRELGTPLDPSKLIKRFLRPAIVTAGSRTRSAPSTTCVIRRSRWTPPPATCPPTCR